VADDDDDEHDDLPVRRPLPPDDRIWRHPSELRDEEPRRGAWWRFRRS
jgi:hypothetical protein